MPSAAVWGSSPAAARAASAARALATLKGPGERRRRPDPLALGADAVNVEPSGPTSTSSARQSASGWPSAEKVVTGTVGFLDEPLSVLVVEVDHAEHGLRFGVNSCALARK